MTNPPPYPDTGVGPDCGSSPSTPRWVKVFVIIALVLFLLLIIMHLTGHSLGGPGSHMHLTGMGLGDH